MPPILSDALVLRTFDMGETSKLAVLLTRERGKVRAVAKGVRGPRARQQSALQPLSEVRVSLHGRQGAELYRLGQCELLHSPFAALTRSLEGSLALPYFVELVDAFAHEGEAEDAVYRLVRVVVAAVEEGLEVAVASRYLEAWLLRLGGLYPPLRQCASCGTALARGALRYHSPAHGFLCESCGPATGPVLDADHRGFLEDVFKNPPAALTASLPTPPGALESFHHRLISAHLERDLRSTRVLHEVARDATPKESF